MAIFCDSNGVSRCIACGERTTSQNHHCKPALEKRRQTIDRLHEQDYVNRRPTEAMRLNSGFYLLSLGGDW